MINLRPIVNLFRSRRAAPAATPAATTRRRSRGQVIVIFAGAMLAFMGLMAIVIDVSWYWANTLRVQRAADAAALAGVVWLPNLYGTRRHDGPRRGDQERLHRRRQRHDDHHAARTRTTTGALIVTISTSVPSFFARVIGIASFPVSRTSKAEFILPVADGQPGELLRRGQHSWTRSRRRQRTRTSTRLGSTPPTGRRRPAPTGNTTTNTSGGAWTNPNRAYTSDNSYATSATNLNQDAWTTFAFGAFQAGATIDGVVVNLEAKVGTAAAACKIKAEVSWNGGTTWANAPQTTATLTTSDAWYVSGARPSRHVWGANHSTWASGDFSAANFPIRLTYLKGAGCGTVSLDDATAVVYSHTVTVDPPVEHHAARDRAAWHHPRDPGLLGRRHHEGRQPRERRPVRPDQR